MKRNRQTLFLNMHFLFMFCARDAIQEKSTWFLLSIITSESRNPISFIKPKEKLFWNLRVWMRFSAIQYKANYVTDFRLAKQSFFSCLFLCMSEKGITTYGISWLFLIQNKLCKNQESYLLSCSLDQGHKPKKTMWSRSKILFRRIQLPLMSK